MPDNDNKFYVGHRERLREKFISNRLADYEKLELLLGYAIPRRDVRPIARGLVDKYGSVYQVLAAPIDDLMAFNGIGRSAAVLIKLVQQMMQIAYKTQIKDTPVFHDEKTLYNYCRITLAGKPIEELHVLYLDNALKLIEDEIHTLGTVNSSMVYPREIARGALRLNARSVVLMHNHPASMNSFSTPDVEITKDVIRVLRGLGVEFYDHLVVASDSVYSMRALHIID